MPCTTKRVLLSTSTDISQESRNAGKDSKTVSCFPAFLRDVCCLLIWACACESPTCFHPGLGIGPSNKLASRSCQCRTWLRVLLASRQPHRYPRLQTRPLSHRARVSTPDDNQLQWSSDQDHTRPPRPPPVYTTHF